jgi:hypothetical protein
MIRRLLPQACNSFAGILVFSRPQRELYLWGLVFKTKNIEFLSTTENSEKGKLPRPYTAEADGA